jgi:DNA-directed RNA polymerase II subunit RPB2
LKPIRTISVKIVTPTNKYTYKNIVVNIPNVRKPVPLFIVFRALGILSDKDIITMCLLDIEKYDNMLDLFIPSVHDAAGINTQTTALKYIATFTKGKTVSHALEILADYFFPHIGEVNFLQKAYYLGYVVFRLLGVYMGLELTTDRDNYKYKRIELVGSLMYDLFREYYTIQQRQIHLLFEEKITFNAGIYENNLKGLIQQNYKYVFSERVVEAGFKKAFKGNWGSQTHTKRIGIVQDINRLSFNSAMSHLRKTSLPLDSSVKLVGPRVLHGTQWGYLDPIDTPDGANIGLHKHLSIMTYITQGYSREPMIKWLREKVEMRLLEDCSPLLLSKMTKVFVNGLFAGAITNPIESVEKIKMFRRNALIPIYTSVSFNIKQNTIYIYTDAGRPCRPIFYKDNDTDKMSYEKEFFMKKLEETEDATAAAANDFTWNELITGFNPKKETHVDSSKIYDFGELYQGMNEKDPEKVKRFNEKKAIIDYIDPSETEESFIAINEEELQQDEKKKYTHMEIHESLIFGMMCNLITFPQNNPATRNSFSCGQSKQACSLYHTNYQVRMDKTAVVLNYGQKPLVKTRYLEHFNHEENSYGENVIVAVMCYTGYNVEDAILVNEGALNRGLFRTTYYSTYETHEEKSKTGNEAVEKIFTNIENESNVVGTKPGYDYSKLDKFGIIRENTEVDEKTVLIGLTASSSLTGEKKVDASKTPKKGQLGIVDKTFITEGNEGYRIAKVRIREQRIPNLGDKMASRNGQKGTVGLVIPESNMPFTKDGIRPDIIINPHALPSRQTIGQLVESITGKATLMKGAFADCTAFNNKGSKIKVFGEMLTQSDFHSSGNEILYNGMTGEQIETEIFIGPTYYMRLKHMVKDKINYRALGPRTALTRQPVSGRANDGGLRIGEMERDSVISHGISEFLRESMMERGDKYYVAVCNTTGMLAIYNPSKNMFMSPLADGPLKFTGSLDGNTTNIENITRYGRDFSVICVPYSFKLLLQELQTINVTMRIITEDNIEQLENMTFSKNIEKLAQQKGKTPKSIVSNTIFNLRKEREQTSIIDTVVSSISSIFNPSSPEKLPPPTSTSPAYAFSVSPAYAPSDSPAYAPTDSPAYAPTDSPAYAPYSPAYAPSSVDESEKQTDSPQYYVSDSPEAASYQLGDLVLLRADTSEPKRIWSITNIGDRFIKIETHQRGNEDVSDNIKIVQPMDIYYPPKDESLYRTGGNFEDIEYNEEPPQPVMNANQMGGWTNSYGGGGGAPQINITPVFKMVGGNDFSTGGIPTSGGEQVQPYEIPNTHIGGAAEPIRIKPVTSTDNGNGTGSESEPSKIDFGGNKFLIKKMA